MDSTLISGFEEAVVMDDKVGGDSGLSP